MDYTDPTIRKAFDETCMDALENFMLRKFDRIMKRCETGGAEEREWAPRMEADFRRFMEVFHEVSAEMGEKFTFKEVFSRVPADRNMWTWLVQQRPPGKQDSAPLTRADFADLNKQILRKLHGHDVV